MCNFIDKRKSNKKAKEKKKEHIGGYANLKFNVHGHHPVDHSCLASIISPYPQNVFSYAFSQSVEGGYQPRWFPNVLSLFSFNVKKWANYFGSDKDRNKKWLAKSWYRDHWHIKMEISSGTEAITMKNCYKYRQHFPLRF